jgi:hypothetical protein
LVCVVVFRYEILDALAHQSGAAGDHYHCGFRCFVRHTICCI